MMFIEFIAPIKKYSQSTKCLCSLYYLKHNLKIEIATVNQIKNILIQGRVFKKKDKTNYTRALNLLEEKVDNPAKGLWQITPTGEKEVRILLKLQEEMLEAKNDTEYLEELVDKQISDNLTKDYLNEGIDCLKVGKLRASVVFLWAGSVYEIQSRVIKYPLKKINSSLLKHDPKARTINKLDDFAYIKESILLLVANDLGIFDKNQCSVLINQCLDLRNKCGHPGKYSPGPKRVSSFIEDLINTLFK